MTKEFRLRIEPLSSRHRKSSNLGAEIVLPFDKRLLDLSSLSNSDKETLRDGVFNHGVVVIRNQQGLDPSVLPELGRFFDDSSWAINPEAGNETKPGKGVSSTREGGSISSLAPQLRILGKGKFKAERGVAPLNLRHVNHVDFHESPHSQEELERGLTRFYWWHMDTPVYEGLPGLVSSMFSIEIPNIPDQRILFPNGDTIEVPAGATAFFSGARAFQLLTDDERHFALNTSYLYIPKALELMLEGKATDDGLSIVDDGFDKNLDELPSWMLEDVQLLPMVWKNPQTGEPHLQIHGCCVYELRTTDPVSGQVTLLRDARKVRNRCYDLMRKVYAPENIYVHRWEEGDLVVFHNRGVFHTATGNLLGSSSYTSPERRLLWQCSLGSRVAPEAYTTSMVCQSKS